MNNPKAITLSKLGLNINYFICHKKKMVGVTVHKKLIDTSEMLDQIHPVREGLINNDYDTIERLCTGRVFKPLTLLRGIYPYKTNVHEIKLIDILSKDHDKKTALLQRIDLIVYTLNSKVA